MSDTLDLIKRIAYSLAMKLIDYTSSERGAQSRVARAIGVPPVSVYHWANGIRPVPVERCAEIERATGGAVTRRDLRRDDWHRIWPELAEREPSV